MTGGKKQVLRRSFKLVTMVGFASTALVAWEFLTVISIYSLQGRGDSHRVLGSDSWMLWYDIRLRFLGRDGFHVSQEAS